MDCPPSSPPRLLPGFAPNKGAKFQIFQDNTSLPSPLPTSERDAVSSPTSEASDIYVPPRRVLEQLKTIKLRPDAPVLVGRSSRACGFVLESSNKLVSRIHARVCYESATDLVTIECLGWNGLTVIVPGRQGPKEYPVVRHQTIYIERVEGIELSIQKVRTFIELGVVSTSETTEDEIEQPVNAIPKSILKQDENPLNKATQALHSLNENTPALEAPKPSKENVKPTTKRVHFEQCEKRMLELLKPATTTLAEYKRRKLEETDTKQAALISSETAALATTNVPSADGAAGLSGTPHLKETIPASALVTFESSEPAAKQRLEDIPMQSVQHAPEQLNVEASATTPASEDVDMVEAVQEPEPINENIVEEPHGEKVATEAENTKITEREPVESTRADSEVVESPASSKAPINDAINDPTDSTAEVVEPVENVPTKGPDTPQQQTKQEESIAENPSTKEHENASEKISKKPKQKYGSAHTPKASKIAAASNPPKVQIVDRDTLVRLAANCVAFSRLNSTPLSNIIASSHEFQSTPRKDIVDILESMACIGVIHREGKDALGKPLEPEYYYISEFDDDQERRQMVIQSKGGKSLRACRRVHKQYFYKRPK